MSPLIEPGPFAGAADMSDIIYIVIAAIYILGSLVKNAVKGKQTKEQPDPEVDYAPPPPPPASDPSYAPPYAPELALEPPPDPVQVGASALDPATMALYTRLDEIAEQATTRRMEARGAAGRAQGRPELRQLHRALDGVVVPRARALGDQVEEVRRLLAEEPAETARALSRLQQEDARVRQLTSLLVEAVDERLGPEQRRRLLAGADRLSALLFEPLRRALFTDRQISALTATAVEGEWTPVAALRFQEVGLLRVQLRPGYQRNFALWALLVHDIGRSVLVGSRRLRTEARQSLGVSGSGELPSGDDLRTGLQISDFVAPWWPTLFGDLLGALSLGPAYYAALATLPAEPPEDRPMLEPPLSLRLAALRAPLADMGFGEEAETTWTRWTEQVVADDDIILTLRDGRKVAAPFSAFVETMARASRVLARAPFPTLGGASLGALPGMALRQDQGEQVEKARRVLMGGELPEGTPPRLVFSAALAAFVQMPATGPRLAEAVLSAIDRRAPGASDTAVQPGVFDLRPTPSVIADAIGFRAVFDD